MKSNGLKFNRNVISFTKHPRLHPLGPSLGRCLLLLGIFQGDLQFRAGAGAGAWGRGPVTRRSWKRELSCAWPPPFSPGGTASPPDAGVGFRGAPTGPWEQGQTLERAVFPCTPFLCPPSSPSPPQEQESLLTSSSRLHPSTEFFPRPLPAPGQAPWTSRPWALPPPPRPAPPRGLPGSSLASLPTPGSCPGGRHARHAEATAAGLLGPGPHQLSGSPCHGAGPRARVGMLSQRRHRHRG